MAFRGDDRSDHSQHVLQMAVIWMVDHFISMIMNSRGDYRRDHNPARLVSNKLKGALRMPRLAHIKPKVGLSIDRFFPSMPTLIPNVPAPALHNPRPTNKELIQQTAVRGDNRSDHSQHLLQMAVIWMVDHFISMVMNSRGDYGSDHNPRMRREICKMRMQRCTRCTEYVCSNADIKCIQMHSLVVAKAQMVRPGFHGEHPYHNQAMVGSRPRTSMRL